MVAVRTAIVSSRWFIVLGAMPRPFVTGDIIVNTDATIRIPSGSLRPLIRVFQDPTVGAASGRDVSLKRFLMDRRVPAQDRSSLPLLAAGRQVLWVPGQRIDGADTAERRFVSLELHSAAAGRHA